MTIPDLEPLVMPQLRESPSSVPLGFRYGLQETLLEEMKQRGAGPG
jgi:hypothetical protein